jgi:hypothetical protein
MCRIEVRKNKVVIRSRLLLIMNNEYMIEMERSRKKLFEDTSMIVAIQMPAGFSRAKIERTNIVYLF